MKTKARVIAIYLPQYHPIPENDATWGKGFTEWVNVAQARPLFKGHNQPHIPADLGFYDLRIPEIREEQAKLAREAGIEGFMYWQYYFGNKKMLLERPFEEVLKSGKPEFPFCLGWANHSWQTKTWKSNTSLQKGKTMIMEQRYDGEQQYIDHFLYNLPAFKDPRYITVDKKPFFAIWNPMDHPEELTKMIKIWQKLAVENGLKGIHFVGVCTIGSSIDRLKEIGFDAVYQGRVISLLNKGRESASITYRIRMKLQNLFGITLKLNKADFKKYYHLLVTDEAKRIDVYPSLLSGYDRTPRAGRKAEILYNFTPESWKLHVEDVLSYTTNKDYEHNIIMLKSWNEWGESNYMEPDIQYGHALLDILKEELTIKE